MTGCEFMTDSTCMNSWRRVAPASTYENLIRMRPHHFMCGVQALGTQSTFLFRKVGRTCTLLLVHSTSRSHFSQRSLVPPRIPCTRPSLCARHPCRLIHPNYISTRLCTTEVPQTSTSLTNDYRGDRCQQAADMQWG